MSAHKCNGQVWHLGGYYGSPCGKNAAYEHAGKWFCKTHHPPTIKEKQTARSISMWAEQAKVTAESKAQAAAQAEQKRRADCYPDLLAALIAAYEYVPPSSPVYQSLADAINKAVQP